MLEIRYFSNGIHEKNRNVPLPDETNIIQSIEDVERTFSSSSDAIILVSDGIHNSAENPYSLLTKKPVYTLGFGEIRGVETLKLLMYVIQEL